MQSRKTWTSSLNTTWDERQAFQIRVSIFQQVATRGPSRSNMANQAFVPNLRNPLNHSEPFPQLLRPQQPGLIKSLFSNIHDALFPEKLPPLKLTSRPVAVRDIWE